MKFLGKKFNDLMMLEGDERLLIEDEFYIVDAPTSRIVPYKDWLKRTLPSFDGSCGKKAKLFTDECDFKEGDE